MSGLAAAVRHLTVVPWPGAPPAHLDTLGRAAPWFPVVGLAIGAVLAGVDRAGGAVFSPLLAALLAVVAWKLLSGGLHLDGLADCLDGLAGADPAQRLAIMRDSRIGAFGAVGLTLFLMLEVVAVADLEPAARWRTLLVAPAVARAMPPLVARLFPPARPDGQGAAFGQVLGWPAVVGALAVGAAAAAAVLGPAGLVAAAAAAFKAVAVGRFMTGRLGGVTGDVLGAVVEAAELLVLLVVLAWAAAAR